MTRGLRHPLPDGEVRQEQTPGVLARPLSGQRKRDILMGNISKISLVVAVAAGLMGTSCTYAQTSADPPTPHKEASVRDTRFVVFHTPGPGWQQGKGMFEQEGLQGHVAHYRKLFDAGKLAMGGPHLDAKSGGMMIPAAGVSEEEIRAFAAEDPAVKSGLLVAEVRPWLVGMGQ
jgi:uncharacterized protein YciI